MRHRQYSRTPGCALETALEVIGSKWKGAILYHLLSGPLRFGALQQCIPAVTPRILTQQLRELEADGIVMRTVYAVMPPRVDYELTALGRALEPVLNLMTSWGRNYMEVNGIAVSADATTERGP